MMDDDLRELIVGARTGDLDRVRRSVSATIINSTGPLGLTPLEEACRAGHTNIVEFLVKGGAVTGDVLRLACEYKGVDMVNALIKSGVPVDGLDKYGRTALHTAVEAMNFEIVESLLKHEASVNKADRQGNNTALHLACEKECLAMVRLLLAYGAKTNLKNKSSSTPLHVACWHNKSLDVLCALLASGASLEETDSFGDTPLHIACDRGCLKMVRLLLEHGADVNATNRRRLTPLRFSFDHEEIITLLLDYGAGSNMCSLYRCPCKTTDLECEIENHSRHIDHLGVFVKHSLKLEAANLLPNIKRELLSDSWGQSDRDSYLAKCRDEIQKLKMSEIGGTKSLYYDLLSRRKPAIRDASIVGQVSSEALQEFPLYGDMIYCSYLTLPECLRRQALIDECSTFFEFTPFSGLPFELVPGILEYLSDADLKHLAVVCWGSVLNLNSPKIPVGNEVADNDETLDS